MSAGDRTPNEIPTQIPLGSGLSPEAQEMLENALFVLKEFLLEGASGTFTTADGKTVTVKSGLITEIV